MVQVDFLTGWRQSDGTHMGGVAITLAPGWKTYWRAPGDGGIPTILDWRGSTNLDAAQILWPSPEIFRIAGSRSVGYSGEVVLPVSLRSGDAGDIGISARLSMGVCQELCIPVSVSLQARLPSADTTPTPRIMAALDRLPRHPGNSGVSDISCTLTRSAAGSEITVNLTAPRNPQNPAMIIETSDPTIWVSEPHLSISGGAWHAEASLVDQRGGDAHALSPEDIRITLLSDEMAVDIAECGR